MVMESETLNKNEYPKNSPVWSSICSLHFVKPVLSRKDDKSDKTITPIIGKNNPNKNIRAPSRLFTIPFMKTLIVSTSPARKKITIVSVRLIPKRTSATFYKISDKECLWRIMVRYRKQLIQAEEFFVLYAYLVRQTRYTSQRKYRRA